jgi:hypothetical protein
LYCGTTTRVGPLFCCTCLRSNRRRCSHRLPEVIALRSDSIGLTYAVRQGWASFAKHPLLAVCASVCWVGVLGGLTAILAWLLYAHWTGGPILLMVVAAVAWMCLSFGCAGGAHRLMLNIVRDNSPRLGNIFAELWQLGKWSSTGLRMTGRLFICFSLVGVFLVMVVPAQLGVARWNANHGGMPISPNLYVTLTIGFLVTLAIGQAFFANSSFAYFLAADGQPIGKCDSRSPCMAKRAGFRTQLALFTLNMFVPAILTAGCVVRVISANAFGLPGRIAFWVVVAFFLTLSLCAVTNLYERLKDPLTAESAQRSAA